jgi:hypothetical protein
MSPLHSTLSSLQASSPRTAPVGTFRAATISADSPLGLWQQEISGLFTIRAPRQNSRRLPVGVLPAAHEQIAQAIASSLAAST